MGPASAARAADRPVRRARAGDAAACTEAYRRFGRPLYGTALRMLRRPEDAEDAVQETFLAMHRSAPEIPGSEAGPWLQRVLVNHCIDRLRRRQRWREDEVRETTTVRPAPQDGARIDLERALERLPERARLVFVLHDVEGYRHKEMAEMLGIKEGTSKSQLFRARELLRGLMAPASVAERDRS